MIRLLGKVTLIYAIFIAVGQKSFAQELEFFEIDDFINPSELRYSESEKQPKPRAFFVSNALVGVDANYQYRNEFTGEDISFLRMANSLYYKWVQTNLKLTWLWKQSGNFIDGLHLNTNGPEDVTESGTIPYFKGRIQVACYLTEPGLQSGGRYQFSWNFEAWPDSSLIQEFSLDLDVSFKIPEIDFGAAGGFIYAWKPWEDESYLGYAVRYSLRQWKNGWIPRWGVGLSGERIGGKRRWGVFRNELSLEMKDFPFQNNSINLICSYSYHIARKQRYVEVGAFFNMPLFARLF